MTYYLYTRNGITSIEQDPDVGPPDDAEWLARIEHKEDVKRDEQSDASNVQGEK